jgi:hypothetical protein
MYSTSLTHSRQRTVHMFRRRIGSGEGFCITNFSYIPLSHSYPHPSLIIYPFYLSVCDTGSLCLRVRFCAGLPSSLLPFLQCIVYAISILTCTWCEATLSSYYVYPTITDGLVGRVHTTRATYFHSHHISTDRNLRNLDLEACCTCRRQFCKQFMQQ